MSLNSLLARFKIWDGTDTLDITATGAAKVDGSAVTQPISGIVTVQDGGNVISVDDGAGSITVDGTVAVSGSVAVTGPLTDTQLRAVAVPVSGTFFQATQPVSGEVALDSTTLAALESITVVDGGGSLTVDGTVAVSNFPAVQPVSDNGGSLTVDGTVAISGTIPVSGGLTDAELRASAVPIVLDAAALAALESITIAGEVALDAATLAALESITVVDGGGSLTVDGTVTANAGTGPWPVTDNGGSLTVDGTVAVSGSVAVTGPLTDTELRASAVPVSGPITDTQIRATPLPVSGTVAATQSGTWNVGDVTGTVSLPTGASTLAEQQTQTTALQLIDDIVRSEDEASGDGHKGAVVLGVRKATPANTSGTDGDYEAIQISAGRLWASATIDAALPAGANAIGKLAANDGVDIGDVTINNASGGSAVNIQDGGNSITVDGTVAVSGSVTVTGPLTDTQLRATAVPVSGTFFQATQPVSGTVEIGATSLAALETIELGATTLAALESITVVDGGGNLSIDDGGNIISIDDGAGSLTVDGTVTANAGSGPWPITDNSGSLTVDDLASGATVTSVDALDSAATLAASTSSRRGLLVRNESPASLYLKYGSDANWFSSYSDVISPYSFWTMPTPIYTGLVTGIWKPITPGVSRYESVGGGVSGNAFVTEVTV